jgi:hypothetical protein
VKFGTKIVKKAQNLSGELRIIALKQRIFVEYLERDSPSTARRNSKFKIQNEYSVSLLFIWNGWLISAMLY